MIEKAIIDPLKADPELRRKLSMYGGERAVFSRLAPEKAILPYITINLTRTGAIGDLVLHDFILMVDYWDSGTSTKRAGEASERIEYVLDNKQFTHTRYSSIRVYFFSGGWVEDEDPRTIHYNQQFSVRACRKKWINQL